MPADSCIDTYAETLYCLSQNTQSCSEKGDVILLGGFNANLLSYVKTKKNGYQSDND